MKKMRLLVSDKIDEQGLNPLEKYFDIDIRIGLRKEDLAEIIDNYDCIITRSSTAITKEVINRATRLKIICRAGIGVDNIDISAATINKIAVINAPCGNAKATAEHTIGLIFSLLRHIPQAASDFKKGIRGNSFDFARGKQKYMGTQISGKTLGIVGFGNIGCEVARIARDIGMKVVVCEPYVRIPRNVTKLTYEELLKTSDIISFHVPLTYLTRRMMNKNTLSLCKDGVYIINCSRGEVVEENAIKNALISGKVTGFAVDVFSREPEVDRSLLELPNVVATPHIAGSTFESQKQSIGEVVEGILKYIKREIPSNLLNPQVFKKSTQKVKSKAFHFDAAVFDCDSTLSAIEGIDELAGMVGKKERIAQFTRDAMEGRVDFEAIFEKRLNMIKPSRKQLLQLGELYVSHLMEDAKEVIEALRLLGKEIYLVSGGYTAALLYLGEKLGISDKNIFGNDLLFDNYGSYTTYIDGPLRRNHGKLQIIRQIPGKKIMIGDSITDLETKECVDLFVGFGGVERRKKVEAESELYLYCRSIAPVLVVTVGIEGCLQLLETRYRRYVGKGLDLLFHSSHVKATKMLTRRFREFKKLAYY